MGVSENVDTTPIGSGASSGSAAPDTATPSGAAVRLTPPSAVPPSYKAAEGAATLEIAAPKSDENEHHAVVVKLEEGEEDGKQEAALRWWQSPYFQIIVYGIACLTTSCLYFGWQPYQDMLFRAGAYAWKCPSDWDFDLDGPCLEQDKAVTRLYSWAQGSEGACAFVAGLLLDHLGPRKTAILGEALFGIAILIIALSSQSFQMYIPAMLLSGGCVNIVAFPSLVVCEAWPTRQALAVSVIVGAQSGASVIAPILKTIWDNNPQYTYFGVWGVYLLAIWLPVSILYILVLPARRNYAKLVKEDTTTVVVDAIENGSDQEGVATSNSALAALPAAEEAENSAQEKSLAPVVQPPTTSKEKWKAFWRDLKTIDLIVCSIYTFLLMLQFAYYPSVVRDAISDDMSEFVGWMTPLQAPFSIVIGFVTDYVGTLWVMFAMCVTLIWVSLTAGLAPGNVGLMRFTAIFFVFMQSATFNIKYTFVNELYDPYNYGKLVGFLGIMGGVGVYVNAPIASSTAYKEIFIAYAIVAVVMGLLTFYCYWRQHKLGISHKTIEGVEQKGYNIKKKDNSDTAAVTAAAAEEVV